MKRFGPVMGFIGVKKAQKSVPGKYDDAHLFLRGKLM